MTLKRISIICRDASGKFAALTAETDREWAPMDAADVGKNFSPASVTDIEISCGDNTMRHGIELPATHEPS